MDAESICKEVLVALEDLKAVNPVSVDVRALTDVMDYLIICSGTSNRHVKSLANNVSVELKKKDVRPLGIEGDDAGEWVLVDYGDVVVHVMLPATRDFYDLERLWSNPDPDSDPDSVPE
jgi:ribosome-associated protein